MPLDGETQPAVLVCTGVDVGVAVGVEVGFGVGVCVGAAVGVGDAVGVAVGLAVGVAVAAGVGVAVAAADGVALPRIGCTGAPEPEPEHDARAIERTPTVANGAPWLAGTNGLFSPDGDVAMFDLRFDADMRSA